MEWPLPFFFRPTAWRERGYDGLLLDQRVGRSSSNDREPTPGPLGPGQVRLPGKLQRCLHQRGAVHCRCSTTTPQVFIPFNILYYIIGETYKYDLCLKCHHTMETLSTDGFCIWLIRVGIRQGFNLSIQVWNRPHAASVMRGNVSRTWKFFRGM